VTSGIKVRGFSHTVHAHAHLLKHVLRVTEVERRRKDAPDGERWEELLSDPPLIADLGRRRQDAVARLSAVPGCPAGTIGMTEKKSCLRCQDRGAQRVVSQDMAALLDAYVRTAQTAFDAAFANRDKQGPRLVAYRDPRERIVETFDTRHLTVVAVLDGDGQARLLTCYRERERSYGSRWLELSRLRAAHKRAGTLENVD
jgi:hypothetical protein